MTHITRFWHNCRIYTEMRTFPQYLSSILQHTWKENVLLKHEQQYKIGVKIKIAIDVEVHLYFLNSRLLLGIKAGQTLEMFVKGRFNKSSVFLPLHLSPRLVSAVPITAHSDPDSFVLHHKRIFNQMGVWIPKHSTIWSDEANTMMPVL